MLLAMIGWGSSWVNGKILNAYMDEYELIFFRNFFTIISLIPILLISRKSFYINKKSLFLAFISSIIMVGYMKCYFLGLKYGTASLGGAFVTCLIPINTFLIMALFFNRKIQKKDFFALSLGIIGIFSILNIWSFSFKEIFNIQNAYFLGASILWPIITIISSKTTKTPPLIFTLYMYIFMTIFVSVFFVDFKTIDYASYDSIFWINIFCLSFVATTFGTSIYFVGIEKLGANEVNSFIFLVPIFAIFLSIIFLDEKINISMIFGTILTIYAVKILNNIKIFKKF